MTALLAAAALVAPCPSHEGGAAEIRGRVRDATARAAVAFAVVEVRPRDGGALFRTRTDRRGGYRVRGVPAGWLDVTVRRQGYRESSVRVRVGKGDCLTVDFAVRRDPVELPALRVRALPAGGRVEPPRPGGADRTAPGVGPGSPELGALRSSPLGGVGLGPAVRRSVRLQPADPSALFLRGQSVPFQQVLLDGAPVQAPFHLAGLLASHPPDVIGSSRLRSGGPEPRFGGGLLYTLDLRTRSPGGDAWSSGSVDLLGASARAGGPVAGAEYLVSARSLYPEGGPGTRPALEGRRYTDGLVRLSAGGEEGLRASATGFWNRSATPLADDADGPVAANWGNAAGSLRLASGGPDRGWRATAAASRYRSELPLTETGRGDVDAGVDAHRAVLRYQDRRGRLAWGGGGALRRTAQRLRVSGDSGVAAASDGAARRLGAFASARWHVSERVSLRGGLRVEHFSPDGSVRAAPRAAATLRVSPETRLQLSAGRVHQLLAGWRGRGEARAGSDSAAAVLRPAPRVARAGRVELRLDHRGGDGLRLGGEAHFRRMEGISAASVFDTVTAASSAPVDARSGSGVGVYSSGLELWGSWRGSGVRIGATYSLSWLWSGPGEDGVSSRFAARQVLSGAAGVPLPGGLRARATLAGSWGLPMTPLPVSGPEQTDVLGGPTVSPTGVESAGPSRPSSPGRSPYVRLDARLERSFSVELFGGPVRLTPYAEVINALDRENSRFHRLPAAGGALQPVNPIPALPVLGIEWEG